MSTDIVIVAAARTAVGKFGGTLAKTPAADLGAAVIAELIKRAKLTGDQIGEVILGQVLTAGVGQNPARQAAIKSGLPKAVPAMTINKVCGSGLKAVMLAAQAIRDGELTIASTGKDPQTGRMETQEYHVEGPVMLFLTTTAIDIDEELQDPVLDAFGGRHQGADRADSYAAARGADA